MYLHYILEEICAGGRAPLDLEGLPAGLDDYYAQTWNACRKDDRGERRADWDTLYAPLLAALTAAQEPVTQEQLAAWAGINASPYEVLYLLESQWRPFLMEYNGADGDVRYSLYHASLRDFVTGNVDWAKLTPGNESLIRELSLRVREAHTRIIEYYRQQCAGDWP